MSSSSFIMMFRLQLEESKKTKIEIRQECITAIYSIQEFLREIEEPTVPDVYSKINNHCC